MSQRMPDRKPTESKKLPLRDPTRPDRIIDIYDYYDVLGIPNTATLDEVKSAYKKMAKIWHPDRHRAAGPDEKKIVEEQFKVVGEAYEHLSDLNKREFYDESRKLYDRPQAPSSAQSGGSRFESGFSWDDEWEGEEGFSGFSDPYARARFYRPPSPPPMSSIDIINELLGLPYDVHVSPVFENDQWIIKKDAQTYLVKIVGNFQKSEMRRALLGNTVLKEGVDYGVTAADTFWFKTSNKCKVDVGYCEGGPSYYRLSIMNRDVKSNEEERAKSNDNTITTLLNSYGPPIQTAGQPPMIFFTTHHGDENAKDRARRYFNFALIALDRALPPLVDGIDYVITRNKEGDYGFILRRHLKAEVIPWGNKPQLRVTLTSFEEREQFEKRAREAKQQRGEQFAREGAEQQRRIDLDNMINNNITPKATARLIPNDPVRAFNMIIQSVMNVYKDSPEIKIEKLLSIKAKLKVTREELQKNAEELKQVNIALNDELKSQPLDKLLAMGKPMTYTEDKKVDGVVVTVTKPGQYWEFPDEVVCVEVLKRLRNPSPTENKYTDHKLDPSNFDFRESGRKDAIEIAGHLKTGLMSPPQAAAQPARPLQSMFPGAGGVAAGGSGGESYEGGEGVERKKNKPPGAGGLS